MEWDMDGSAECAAEELNPGWTAQELAQWWAKWYPKAGEERLGRLLLSLARGRNCASEA